MQTPTAMAEARPKTAEEPLATIFRRAIHHFPDSRSTFKKPIFTIFPGPSSEPRRRSPTPRCQKITEHTAAKVGVPANYVENMLTISSRLADSIFIESCYLLKIHFQIFCCVEPVVVMTELSPNTVVFFAATHSYGGSSTQNRRRSTHQEISSRHTPFPRLSFHL